MVSIIAEKVSIEGSDEKTFDQEQPENIPIIDLSLPQSEIVEKIADACSTWGFFQVINHGISSYPTTTSNKVLISDFREEMVNFFNLPYEEKKELKRNDSNARGFFDDELTKRRRDWKECLDVGVPGSRDWSVPDMDECNQCLDGYNQFPQLSSVPNFRKTVVLYFQQCTKLSEQLARYMALGLTDFYSNHCSNTNNEDKDVQSFLKDLQKNHTSYLRMNYYPPYKPTKFEHNSSVEIPEPLGISPHTDAGFLTVLLQDDDCHSLQVAKPATFKVVAENDSQLPSDIDWQNDDYWITVRPIPGALTINTGDMAMIWSNGRYKAPLHRVKTNSQKKRYSAPFFYNPGYNAAISPLSIATIRVSQNDSASTKPKYHPCRWGYFRAVRFAGDVTDIGVEIQISDFDTDNTQSTHLRKQEAFSFEADFSVPFSVSKYQPLLEDS